jgi:hypothetical protein
MCRTFTRRAVTVTAVAALMLGGGSAFADTQPSNVGSSEVRPEPDPLTPGPHCHIALAAGDNKKFDEIVTATRHQAHVQTIVRGPGGIFAATTCP